LTYAQANQSLKKGDLLLEIDPAPYQYTITGAEVALLAKSYRLAVATVGAAWLSPISATTTPTT
jgi:multidrug resistance efflux pump